MRVSIPYKRGTNDDVKLLVIITMKVSIPYKRGTNLSTKSTSLRSAVFQSPISGAQTQESVFLLKGKIRFNPL